MNQNEWLLLELKDQYDTNEIPKYIIINSDRLITKDDICHGKLVLVQDEHNVLRKAEVVDLSDDKQSLEKCKIILEKQINKYVDVLSFYKNAQEEMESGATCSDANESTVPTSCWWLERSPCSGTRSSSITRCSHAHQGTGFPGGSKRSHISETHSNSDILLCSYANQATVLARGSKRSHISETHSNSDILLCSDDGQATILPGGSRMSHISEAHSTNSNIMLCSYANQAAAFPGPSKRSHATRSHMAEPHSNSNMMWCSDAHQATVLSEGSKRSHASEADLRNRNIMLCSDDRRATVHAERSKRSHVFKPRSNRKNVCPHAHQATLLPERSKRSHVSKPYANSNIMLLLNGILATVSGGSDRGLKSVSNDADSSTVTYISTSEKENVEKSTMGHNNPLQSNGITSRKLLPRKAKARSLSSIENSKPPVLDKSLEKQKLVSENGSQTNPHPLECPETLNEIKKNIDDLYQIFFNRVREIQKAQNESSNSDPVIELQQESDLAARRSPEHPRLIRLSSDDENNYIPNRNGKVIIPAGQLNAIDRSAATRQLQGAISSGQLLATHPVNRKKPAAFVKNSLMEQLGSNLIKDIAHTVSEQRGVKRKRVRANVTAKCSDKSKLYRNRKQQKMKKENQENIPPFSESSD